MIMFQDVFQNVFDKTFAIFHSKVLLTIQGILPYIEGLN
jgi:hypothetical protein